MFLGRIFVIKNPNKINKTLNRTIIFVLADFEGIEFNIDYRYQ